MTDLMSVVDWSRWQFALTAMYHWLFVPLTLGLGLIVAVMETVYYRTRSERWLSITKFWMKLFGINFALGVATGIILEFEFGTNWSNYSWFVGDIFGAPLAIEGLLAFFMESTFIAVMFFGWKKVSRGFHLASTWLTVIGAMISALWILVANAWMQYPTGMQFDPEQMRNVMDNFWAVIGSPVAIHKFCHTVLSGLTLGGAFVCGVCGWFMLRKYNREFSIRSLKVGSVVGLVGILLTMWTGDASAVDVYKYQPMKLAAMEGLYQGEQGQSIVAFGILNPEKTVDNDADPFLFEVSLPQGLSLLCERRTDAFIPGINDLISGRRIGDDGVEYQAPSYNDRIAAGLEAHDALRAFDNCRAVGDTLGADEARARLMENYGDFGYGYLTSPTEAVPPVAMTFYSFHIMVTLGGYLLLFMLLMCFIAFKKQKWAEWRWLQWVAILTIPLTYICSEAGWVTAEVGRQPWIIQDLMPARAAISFIDSGTVQLTFWLFAFVFTALLAAEVSIMVRQIRKQSKSTDYETLKD